MNERIRQLAEQAGISLSQKDFSYYWVESAEDIEKFAELIVRECATLADCPNSFKHRLGNKIRKYFGVGE